MIYIIALFLLTRSGSGYIIEHVSTFKKMSKKIILPNLDQNNPTLTDHEFATAVKNRINADVVLNQKGNGCYITSCGVIFEKGQCSLHVGINTTPTDEEKKTLKEIIGNVKVEFSEMPVRFFQ